MKSIAEILLAGCLVCTCFCASWSAAAESVPPLDKEMAAKAERMRGNLVPSAEQKLAAAVKGFERNVDFSKARESAVDAVTAQFENPSPADIEAMAFLVMCQATRDMDDDIRAIMAEVKAMTEAKRKIRESLKELNEWISDEMSKHGESSDIDNAQVDAKPSPTRLRAVSPARTVAAPTRTPIAATRTPMAVTRTPVAATRTPITTTRTPVAATRTPVAAKTRHFGFEYVKSPRFQPPDPEGLSLAELEAEVERLEGELDSIGGMSEEMSGRILTQHCCRQISALCHAFDVS
ncbi:hypothetical protein JW916_03855 [Candidatus Sumerlaeota bacterium]|nr:hypothetical protein [Candidatus Sumerlaeota bacterium]